MIKEYQAYGQKMKRKNLLKLYIGAEKAKTRKKARKIIEKFDKKVRGDILRRESPNTPKPLAITEV